MPERASSLVANKAGAEPASWSVRGAVRSSPTSRRLLPPPPPSLPSVAGAPPPRGDTPQVATHLMLLLRPGHAADPGACPSSTCPPGGALPGAGLTYLFLCGAHRGMGVKGAWLSPSWRRWLLRALGGAVACAAPSLGCLCARAILPGCRGFALVLESSSQLPADSVDDAFQDLLSLSAP